MVVLLECTKAGVLPIVEHDSSAEQDANPADFFVKALVRIEKALYETVSACNIVDFSIKAKVFKRISGRQQNMAASAFLAMQAQTMASNGALLCSLFISSALRRQIIALPLAFL
jgi:hypothetical protein